MKAEIIDIENRKTVERINEKRAGSSKVSVNEKTSSKTKRNKRNQLPILGRSEIEDITVDLVDITQ